MNPVTRRLLDRIDDPGLADLALCWDAFEELLVSIHRAGAFSKGDKSSFERRRRRCLELHRAWSSALEPHWRQATVAGALVPTDPFETILGVTEPARWIDNRSLLSLLPAAREALNGLLLERSVDGPRL